MGKPCSLKLYEIYREKGEKVGFALSDPLIHWSFKRGDGLIPFTRSSSPPFILNSLTLRSSCEHSDYQYGFNFESSVNPSIKVL